MVAVASADTRRSFCHHRYQLLPRLLVGPTTRETTDKALTRNKMKKEERILRRAGPKHSGRHSFSLHLSTLPMRTNYPENADRHTSIVPLQHSPAAFPPFFSFYFFFVLYILDHVRLRMEMRRFFSPHNRRIENSRPSKVRQITWRSSIHSASFVDRFVAPAQPSSSLPPHPRVSRCPINQSLWRARIYLLQWERDGRRDLEVQPH